VKLIKDIHNLHRFRSVQISAVGGAAGLALAAYGTALAISPQVVAGVPQWVLTVLVGITMATPFAAIWARALDQPNLPPTVPKPPASNDFHQRQPPC
jgi:hypothetical protein